MSQDLVDASKDVGFHYYPVHFLMSIFDTAEMAEQMIAEFLRTGVAAADVHTWRDAAGERALDADGVFHGWPARVWRWAERATGEHQILLKYEDALRRGCTVLAIHCDPELVRGFVGRLETHRAKEIRYFAAGGIETISTE